MKSTDNIKQNAASDQSMRNLTPQRSQKPPQGQALEASDGLIKGTIGRKGENRGEDLARLSQFLYEAAAPLSLVADIMNPEKNGDLIERYQSEVLGYKNPDGRIDPGGRTLQAIKSLRGQETVMGWYATGRIEDQPEKEAEAGPKSQVGSSHKLALSGSIGRDGKNSPEDLKALADFLAHTNAPGLLIGGLTNPSFNGDVIEKYQREVLGFRNPDGLIEPGGKTLGAIRRMQGREVVAGWFAKKGQPAITQDDEKSSSKGFGPGGKSNIELVISEDAFFSQLAGKNAVPLSFLKANMNTHKTESGYRNVACYQTCRYIVMQSGHQPHGKSTADYLVEASFSGSKEKGNFKKWISGIDHEAEQGKGKLDEMLEAGMPVIVGVNRNSEKHNAKWTNTHREGGLSPTDHYVVIVGRIVQPDGSVGYRYFDPGRTNASNGADPKNLLVVENGYIKGQGYKSTYTISEVRNTTLQ